MDFSFLFVSRGAFENGRAGDGVSVLKGLSCEGADVCWGSGVELNPASCIPPTFLGGENIVLS